MSGSRVDFEDVAAVVRSICRAPDAVVWFEGVDGRVDVAGGDKAGPDAAGTGRRALHPAFVDEVLASLPVTTADGTCLGLLAVAAGDARPLDAAQIRGVEAAVRLFAPALSPPAVSAPARSGDAVVLDLRTLPLSYRYNLAFTRNCSALAIVDVADRALSIVHANDAMAALTGLSSNALNGRSFMALVHDDDCTTARTALVCAPASRIDLRVLGADGHVRWMATSVSIADGGHHALVRLDDVTERRRVEARLTHQALHDPLTGLPNRQLLLDRLARVQASDRSDGVVAVAYLDLDGFKTVNDTHGHGAGDAVLVEVARRIAASVRPSDTVGRIGGDEFLVILDALPDEDETTKVVERIRTAVALPIVVEPMRADGPAVTVGVSVGLAYATLDDSPDALLRRADTALYHAKRAARIATA